MGEVSGRCRGSFGEVLGRFRGAFGELSGSFRGSFGEVWGRFRGGFKEVSGRFREVLVACVGPLGSSKSSALDRLCDDSLPETFSTHNELQFSRRLGVQSNAAVI